MVYDRAAGVVVQRVRGDKEETFLEWHARRSLPNVNSAPTPLVVNALKTCAFHQQ